MTPTRREFLAGAAVLGAGLGLQAWPAAAADALRLMSAARVGGKDGGALWSQTALHEFALPARGHAPAQLGDNRVVLVGRQPGKFAALVDPATLAAPRPDIALIEPAQHFRFGGHAAAQEGSRSFVTGEFHEVSGNGLIVVRDAVGREQAHWQAGGIGPHDLLYAKGGSRLVVAFGGLLQEPDVRSPPLNAGVIESSLVELDAKSGRLLARRRLPANMASLSLRHLALAPDGETIVIGMQDQDLTEPRPVIGIMRVGKEIELLPPPKDEPNLFRGYIGSVAIDAGGRYFAATSPRGGAIGLWSLGDGRWIGSLRLSDACGLASDTAAGVFWATSGLGDIVRLSASTNGLTAAARFRAAAQFDNHAIRI